jgi:hypothetical protein
MVAGLPDPGITPLDGEYSEESGPVDDRPPLLWPGLRGLTGTVFAAVAVLFLQITVSAYYWIADPSVPEALTPTWDLAGLVLLVVVVAAVARARWVRRVLVGVLSTLVFFYFVLGIGQGFALHEFGYEVILRLHVAFVPELFRMMYNAEPLGWFILYVALLVVGTLAVVLAIYGSVRHLYAFAWAGRRRQIGLTAGVAAAFALAAVLLGVNGPLSAEAIHQLDMAVNLDARINDSARKLELETAPLRRKNPFVGGGERPTILLFVVESYGNVLWSDPEFAGFPGWLEEKGKALEQAGYTIASKNMTAPVFGGSSWLAGSSLLCGVRIADQKRYEALFFSRVQCLPTLLNEAGYRTVVSAANAKYLEQSYARMFPFDKFYFRDDFGYRGPRMGWSFMPDQLTLDHVHRREVAPRMPAGRPGAEPLFVIYFLTTSHHPWATIPPFVADWSKIGDGSIYGQLPIKEFHKNGFIEGSDYKPAYRASIEYSISTVAAYLELLPRDDRSLVIMLGDHQPRRPIGRMKKDAWTVPIHVLSRDPAAVARFSKVGFAPGVIPAAQPGKPTGLERLVEELFTAYQTGGAPARP